MSSRNFSTNWDWDCILQARSHDWALHPVTRFHAGDLSLEVELGGVWRCEHTLSAETIDLLNLFLPLVARVETLAIAQLGQSLDGRIATESGASHYINGLQARTHLHRLRALVDAVVVGVGTVNDDDPLLTVRHVKGRNPVRVVLDPRARMSAERQLASDGAAQTLHVVGRDHADEAYGHDPNALPGLWRVVFPTTAQGGFEVQTVLDWLHAQGLRRVLIEGGGVTISRFMQAGALDRMHFLIAPLLIGSGRPGLQLPPVLSLQDAQRPRCRIFACGEDTIFDLDLRRAAHSEHAAHDTNEVADDYVPRRSSTQAPGSVDVSTTMP